MKTPQRIWQDKEPFPFFATSTLLCITVLANKFVGLTEFERLCSCLCLFMFLCLCLCLEAHNRHNDAPAGWHLQLMITIPAVAYEKSSWAAVCCIIIGVGEGQAGGLTTAEGRCSWRALFWPHGSTWKHSNPSSWNVRLWFWPTNCSFSLFWGGKVLDISLKMKMRCVIYEVDNSPVGEWLEILESCLK